MEEKRFRMKINWFQFLCCISVIWNHAGNAELFLGSLSQEHWLMQLEYKFIPAVLRVNIPCFLMMSGYLFYRDFTICQLPGKWKRRVKSLLIPYICWNLIYYFGYLAASKVGALAPIVNRPGMTFSLGDMVDAMVFYKSNPVFWFMYQLILLVALAPVIYMFIQNIWSGILFLTVLLAGVFFRVSLPRVNLDALFYYSVAGYLALHSKELIEDGWSRQRALFGAVLLVLGIWIGRPYYTEAFIPVIVVYHVLAVFAIWLIVDERWFGFWKSWMGDTFFIYAVHFILVRFINKAAAGWFYGSGKIAAFLYMSMPLLMVPICCVMAAVMKRLTPRLWRLLNGGRGMAENKE